MIDRLRFEHVESIDSTNAALMRRPFGVQPLPPCALLADHQTAGRGRNGRQWLDDSERSLLLSVSIDLHAEDARVLGLPLAAGVVLAELLEQHAVSVRLKWPNDLYLDGPAGPVKAGGILVEARQSGAVRRIVIGCGLNLSPSHAITPDTAHQPVGALFAVQGPPPREQLARRLASELVAATEGFARDGLPPFIDRWRSRDLLAGQEVDVIRPDGRRDAGIARGIDEVGALIVDFDDGRIEHCMAGDVSVRRRPDAGLSIDSGARVK